MGVALAVDVLARDRASGTLRKIGNETEKTHRKFAAFAGGLAGGALTAGIISFGKSSAAAFKESEESQKRLEFAFAKFPKTANVNIKTLRALNTALAKKTKYDDDAIASGQAVLAQFNLTGKQIQQVTPLLLDYADTTGKSIPDAGMDLGKALLGNAKALKNVGIAYKSTGDSGKDFENIQALLNKKVGGFAEREGKTAAGQAAILRNQYGELQEQVGAKLVPAMSSLAEHLLDVVDFVDRNSKVIKPLAITLGLFAGTVWTVNKAVAAWQATEKAFLAIKALFTAATVAEGAAATTTAVEVGALATAEVAAGTAGAGAAVGVASFGAAAAVALPEIVAIAAATYGFVELLKWMDSRPETVRNALQGTQTATINLPKQSPTITFNGHTYASSGPPRELGKDSSGSVTSISPGNKAIQLRARGGNIEAGGAYIVGESGPELITPRRAGYVHSNRSLNVNTRARLDTSQIVDRRHSPDRLLINPVTGARSRSALTPPGMIDYWQQHTTIVRLNDRDIAVAVNRYNARAGSNGSRMGA